MSRATGIAVVTPWRVRQARAVMRGHAPTARLLQRVGPCRFRATPEEAPFATLVRSIVSQLLSTAAAATIHGRLCDQLGQQVTAANLLDQDPQALRDVGLSWGKVHAMRDLAEKASEGVIPDAKTAATLSDGELVQRITSVRGVGLWTAQMFLIFNLGRSDIWPVGDLGVRRGYQLAFGLQEMPDQRTLSELGEPFRGHRTIVSWYLWRACRLDWPGD